MRLSNFTDYSLRVLIYLGVRRGRLVTIGEIAERYAISRNHLMKVVHQLGLSGFVETVRGKNGGLRLSRSPGTIRLGDIVRATEQKELVQCFGVEAKTCRIAPVCRLGGILHEALDAFFSVLDRHTLADLLEPSRDDLSRLLGLGEDAAR